MKQSKLPGLPPLGRKDGSTVPTFGASWKENVKQGERLKKNY
jgi:hypothetical protein